MTEKIQTALARIRLYLDQVEAALSRGDSAGALPHLAEVGEIARRLYNHLRDYLKEQKF
jgi:hypothetical protein